MEKELVLTADNVEKVLSETHTELILAKKAIEEIIAETQIEGNSSYRFLEFSLACTITLKEVFNTTTNAQNAVRKAKRDLLSSLEKSRYHIMPKHAEDEFDWQTIKIDEQIHVLSKDLNKRPVPWHVTLYFWISPYSELQQEILDSAQRQKEKQKKEQNEQLAKLICEEFDISNNYKVLNCELMEGFLVRTAKNERTDNALTKKYCHHYSYYSADTDGFVHFYYNTKDDYIDKTAEQILERPDIIAKVFNWIDTIDLYAQKNYDYGPYSDIWAHFDAEEFDPERYSEEECTYYMLAQHGEDEIKYILEKGLNIEFDEVMGNLNDLLLIKDGICYKVNRKWGLYSTFKQKFDAEYYRNDFAYRLH